MFGLDAIVVGLAFIAGIIMFLAPCTLPLVPAYLAFVAGIPMRDITESGPHTWKLQRKLLLNSTAFTIGFSSVFIFFGVSFAFAGSQFGQYRALLAQIGGVVVIMLGLTMLRVIRIPKLSVSYKVAIPPYLTPGTASSAFLIGAIFSLGWTPCVGPLLASILLLASDASTVFSGGILLFVFSLGMAIPFILTALLFGRVSNLIARHSSGLKVMNIIGGLFLIGIGLLLVTNNFGLTIVYGYRLFEMFNYESILRFL